MVVHASCVHTLFILTFFIILIFIHRREDAYAILPRTNLPSVHFFSSTKDSDSTELSLSLSLSYEMPVSYSLSDLQIGGVTTSTIAPKSLGSTGVSHLQLERSLGKQTMYKIFSTIFKAFRSISLCV